MNYKVPPPISDDSSSSSSPQSTIINTKEDDINIDIDTNTMHDIHHHNNDHAHHVEFDHFPSEEELSHLPKGSKGGHKVVRTFTFQSKDETHRTTATATATATTIQEALTILDPIHYPTLTRARKACRKGSILIHRGPILIPENYHHNYNLLHNAFSSKNCQRARVGDTIYNGDIIAVQIMMGTFNKKRCYPNITYPRPRFILPVLYEDDHMAIVDKPAGIGMYARYRMSKSGKKSRRTVHDMLPYILTPPSCGGSNDGGGGVLRRPQAVHRLDTPTNGLVVVAKTKVALDSFYRQFEKRIVKKTYHAIVNGIIPIQESPSSLTSSTTTTSSSSSPSSQCNKQTTVKNKPENDKQQQRDVWNKIDYPLGSKQSITMYKTIRSSPSLHAKDGTLTLVEVQPHTGRYHQIRRHFAWITRRPLVGDALYAGHLQAPRFHRNGLYLCSNGIRLDHPFYNSADVKMVMMMMGIDRTNNDNESDNKKVVVNSDDTTTIQIKTQNDDGSTVCFTYNNDMGDIMTNSSVQISVTKALPKRFTKLLDGEELWARK